MFDIEGLDLFSYNHDTIVYDASMSVSVSSGVISRRDNTARKARYREYRSSEHASCLRQFFVPYNDATPANANYDDDSLSLGASDGQDREDYLDRLLFFPPWIREQAAATEYVQELLGDEVSRITPMFVLLFEFYVKCALIIVYRIAIHEELDDDAIAASTNSISTAWEIFALYGGGAFLFLRNISRAINLWHLRMFYDACFLDLWRWVDGLCAVFLIGTTIWMHFDIESGVLHYIQFSELAAITTGFLWLQMISYLRAVWLRFSLFVDVVLWVGSACVPSFVFFIQ